jgi:coenzyme F420-0:L-glutamate ligase/coenzyme F420-1:gamma-L-glutamate ligase
MNAQANAIYEVVEGRRSIRRYMRKGVERSALTRILQAATCAPSAHNRQPWRWIVIQDEARKRTLAESMGVALARTRIADGDEPEEVQVDVDRSIERICQAPVVLLLCLTMEEMDRYPDPDRTQAEYLMAVQSVAMAGQNLMLSAHAEGLGSSWMCAPLFAPDSVHAVLDIPPDWTPQGLILVGHPESPGGESSRKALEEVVRWM